MGSAIWTVVVILLCVGLGIVATVMTVRARDAVKRHVGQLAAELGLAPGMNQPDFYFGTIRGWPVRLSIESSSGLPHDSRLLGALIILGVLDGVTAIAASQLKPVKLAVLEISGNERPAELDQLVARSGEWRKDLDPWKLVIAGDNTIRWVQRLQPGQKVLLGEHVLGLLALTLGIDAGKQLSA